ncbi:MAG: endonuclease/exonuclease/phosphatase family protein, partial [Actinomycetota bacterium]|nr:endonuclease/exonuclease/phosphatase family protein [Actinomycetota bacterium]
VAGAAGAATAGPAAAGPPLRVATANLFLDNRRIAETGKRLLAAGADVVLLQEVTPSHAQGLRELLAAYPYRFVDAREGAFGSAILSRFPMLGAEQTPVAGHPLTRARLDVNGQEVQVWNVHPPAPRDGASRRILGAQLRDVARRASATEAALVVAGDFNATRWSPELARLRSAGLTDAHEATHRGLAATWPADRMVPPFLLLDHVLVSSGLRVASVAELAAGASDHRPVVADLRLQAGQRQATAAS